MQVEIQDKTGNMLPRIGIGRLFVLVLTMVVEPTGAKSVATPRSRTTQPNDKLPSEAVRRRIEVSDKKPKEQPRRIIHMTVIFSADNLYFGASGDEAV